MVRRLDGEDPLQSVVEQSTGDFVTQSDLTASLVNEQDVATVGTVVYDNVKSKVGVGNGTGLTKTVNDNDKTVTFDVSPSAMATLLGLKALATQDTVAAATQLTGTIPNGNLSFSAIATGLGLKALALQDTVAAGTQLTGTIPNGNLSFSAIATALGLKALALQDTVTAATQLTGTIPNGNLSFPNIATGLGLGALATQATVDGATQITGIIPFANITGTRPTLTLTDATTPSGLGNGPLQVEGGAAIKGTSLFGRGVRLQQSGGVIATSSINNSNTGWSLHTANFDVQDTTTASGATNSTALATNVRFQPFTLTAANTNVTVSNAYNVFIAGAPTAFTNVTLTNAFALFVNSGRSRFDTIETVGAITGGGNITTATGTVTGATVASTGNVTATGNSFARGTVIGAHAAGTIATATINNSGVGWAFSNAAYTIQDTATANGGTNAQTPQNARFTAPSIGSVNGNVTVNNAYNVYITGAPTPTTGVTAITDSYALFVNSGRSRFATVETTGAITGGSTVSGTDITASGTVQGAGVVSTGNVTATGTVTGTNITSMNTRLTTVETATTAAALYTGVKSNLVAGSNITITPNDTARTLTVAATLPANVTGTNLMLTDASTTPKQGTDAYMQYRNERIATAGCEVGYHGYHIKSNDGVMRRAGYELYTAGATTFANHVAGMKFVRLTSDAGAEVTVEKDTAALKEVNVATRILNTLGWNDFQYQNVGNGVGVPNHVVMGPLVFCFGRVAYPNNGNIVITMPSTIGLLLTCQLTPSAQGAAGAGQNVPAKLVTSSSTSVTVAGQAMFTGDASSQLYYFIIYLSTTSAANVGRYQNAVPASF